MSCRCFCPGSLIEKPGSWVRLRFFIPGREKPLSLSGEVRWSGFHPSHECNGVGIELDQLCETLGEFVEQGNGVAALSH